MRIYRYADIYNKFMTELIYKDLTYRINGVLFEAHNELGQFANEKQYADIIENKLKAFGIDFDREKIMPPSFEGEAKGRHRVDFLVEDKLLLELKAKHFLTKEDYYQTQRYLKALNVKLAILVNFRQKRLTPKRILNSAAKE